MGKQIVIDTEVTELIVDLVLLVEKSGGCHLSATF